MRTRIKVCGITRVDDALRAAALGVDALGFVFWPKSPRFLSPRAAAAIAAALPPFVATVGVFVDQPLDEIRAIAAEVGLSAVQLHGDEPAGMWTRVPGRCIRAVGAVDGLDAAEIAAWPAAVWPLLDAHDPDRRGGTGRTIDWDLAARVARARRIILAGGLDAFNIRDAIARVGPFAVDVSSGVEREPGVKDAARLRAFVEGVAAADAAQVP
ncbi:MAG: phosphoribosylanthranilate isomerase [Vicinamibacterales bacterium]